jgi:hypothetical protein
MKAPFIAWALCFALLCAVQPCAAQSSAEATAADGKPWFSSDIFERHSIGTHININNGTGVELYRVAGDVMYRFEGDRLSGTAGVQCSTWTTDIVTNGVWYPLKFRKFKIGFGALYHFGRFRNVEYEHDFFLGTYLAFQPFEHFYINTDISGSIKITYIPSLPREFNTLRDNGLALSVHIGTVFAKRFRVEAVIASYEMFRYHLFLNPTFSLSTAYVFKNGFFAGLTMGVRYSDIFTLTSHVDNYFGLVSFGVTL